jgi:hypothetical protein
MKKLSLILLLITLLTPIFSQVTSYLVPNGLAAWWSFTGNANDESGNNNNGTVINATLTTDRFGNQNSAYYFNGSDAKISISAQPNLNLRNSVSVSAWINPERMGGQIVFRGDSQSAKDPYFLHIRDSSVYFQKYVGSGFTACYAKFDTTLLIPNVYNHVVGTFDSSSSRYRIYLNGEMINEQIMPGTIGYSTTYMNNYIGSVTDNTQNFMGNIDDIGIWNRELNKDEVSTLYAGCQNSVTLSSLVLNQYIGSNCAITATTINSNSEIQWQTNLMNYGWLNVQENNTYIGADSNILTINNIQPYNYNQQFRAISNYYGCIDTSDIATINLNDTLFQTVIDTIFLNYCDTMIINTPLSISPLILNSIKIYPNPASTFLFIEFGNYSSMNNYKIRITNTLGQVVYETLIYQPNTTIDLNTWTGNGLYLVNIIDPQNNIIDTKKIILQ